MVKERTIVRRSLKLFCVFYFFIAENDYFDQGLECAVPKRWSKYTTPNILLFYILHHAATYILKRFSQIWGFAKNTKSYP